jgi:hypothetical protein
MLVMGTASRCEDTYVVRTALVTAKESLPLYFTSLLDSQPLFENQGEKVNGSTEKGT